MPRKPRERSPLDLYHIVFRGTNKQIIFESYYDYQRYLNNLSKAKASVGFEIHAYCLMSNHVHLLVRIPLEKLPKISLHINGSYAHFYNRKYNRTGHLFEIRYGSIPINTIDQYKNTVRYIHQNPVTIDIISNHNAHKYLWSSYGEIMDFSLSYGQDSHKLTDCHLILDIFNEKSDQPNNKVLNPYDISKMRSFHSIISKEGAYENDKYRLTDQEAIDIILKELGHKFDNIKDIQRMDKSSRNELIQQMRKLKLSITQIARITGIGRNIIERAK